MPPEARLLSLGTHLPGAALDNAALAERLGVSADALLESTCVRARHYAGEGEGPSALAQHAAEQALAGAGVTVDDLSLIVFATATPDVTFPGSACFLQDKLSAGTVGAIDIRAQSAGFIAGLDLAIAFSSVPGSVAGTGGGPSHVMVASGEVFSSGLDESPRGRELTSRLADGAAVGIVGRSDEGARVAALRWHTDGSLAEQFWCEYPASGRYPLRIMAEDLEAGLHYPTADLSALAPVVQTRLGEVAREVLDEAGWSADSLEVAIIDYIEPRVARAAAAGLGLDDARIDVPTESFGHVMSAGLPLRLADWESRLAPGARVLLAAAGPGLAWGAVALELG
ncbi:MAG: 3-oxoacyl-[acyl-carrier-protein] synthase III C-terminal domain-containing protein [Candidatus Binatia bacterium]|nr:3-oxoacyl-[acyl-carrier-protein] synthase III C-terminal domain-containing protein [Candidatus Binatia bacterium]